MFDSSRYGLIADDSPVRRFCIAASLRWRKSFSSCSARTRSSIDRIHSVFLVRDRRAASLFATMRFARRGERFSTSSALDRAFGRLLTIPLSCTTSYTPSYSVAFLHSRLRESPLSNARWQRSGETCCSSVSPPRRFAYVQTQLTTTSRLMVCVGVAVFTTAILQNASVCNFETRHSSRLGWIKLMIMKDQ